MATSDDGWSDDAQVGGRLRRARSDQGLSLRALARLIDVSPATLSQIENGHTALTVLRLNRVADALGLTAAEILALDAEDRAHPGDLPAPQPVGPRTDGQWRLYGPLEFDPVLQAALEEFLAIGYHGATVRGIAARSGLSVSGIYHYYASKQQMLARILELTMSDLLSRAHRAQAQGRDAAERFGLLVENLVLFHTHRRELGFVGSSEMRSLNAANRPRIAEQRTQQQRMVDHEVEHAVRSGRFRADHPHEAARAVVTMCTALPTWWRPEGPLTPEQLAEQYVGIAFDVMRTRVIPRR